MVRFRREWGEPVAEGTLILAKGQADEHDKTRISESEIIEDQELAEYFNVKAKRYMKIPCQRVLKRVLAKGVKKGRALDIGTGPGIFPIFISKALPEIQFKGIDLSPVMIGLAKKNAIEEGVNGRMVFEVGSAYSLPAKIIPSIFSFALTPSIIWIGPSTSSTRWPEP